MKDPAIQSLREVFQANPHGVPPGPDCPGAERFWDAVAGNMEPAEKYRLIDHSATCSICAAAWQLAVQLRQHSGGELNMLPTKTPTPVWRRRVLTPLAGLAASLLIFFLLLPSSPPPIYRVDPSIHIQSLGAAKLPRDSCRLRWSLQPESEHVRYRVQVSTASLTTVAIASDLTEPEYLIPESTLTHLPAGARLLWRVTAILPEGNRIQSETFVSFLE